MQPTNVQMFCKDIDQCQLTKQEALLLQRGRMMLRVCIASIQNVERSLLLLVVSASDIPLRTIKFFSVLFGVFVHAVQAVTNIPRASHSAACDVIAGKDCGMFVYFEICDFVLFF